jgi:hypothetical protein
VPEGCDPIAAVVAAAAVARPESPDLVAVAAGPEGSDPVAAAAELE